VVGRWDFVYSGLALVALNMLRDSGTQCLRTGGRSSSCSLSSGRPISALISPAGHFGGPKIAPAISPKKTWSGGFGGVGSAIVAALVVFLCAGRRLWTRRCACDRPVGDFAGRGFLRIVDQTAQWREGFEPYHSRDMAGSWIVWTVLSSRRSRFGRSAFSMRVSAGRLPPFFDFRRDVCHAAAGFWLRYEMGN
jgi:hypothetical protein